MDRSGFSRWGGFIRNVDLNRQTGGRAALEIDVGAPADRRLVLNIVTLNRAPRLSVAVAISGRV